MQPFHVACPFTSLPVCQCRLYAPAPPRYARDPLRVRAPPNERALRRALLLDILSSARPPPGLAQAPPPAMTRALFWRAMRGRLPPIPDALRLLSDVSRACDLEKERLLVSVTARAAAAKERVDLARQDLQRLELRDGRRDRHLEPLQSPQPNRNRSPMHSDSDRNPTPTSSDTPSDDSDDEDVTIRQLATRRTARGRPPNRTITRRRTRR